MRRITTLSFGMTAAVALVALGCENLPLSAVNPVAVGGGVSQHDGSY